MIHLIYIGYFDQIVQHFLQINRSTHVNNYINIVLYHQQPFMSNTTKGIFLFFFPLNQIETTHKPNSLPPSDPLSLSEVGITSSSHSSVLIS